MSQFLKISLLLIKFERKIQKKSQKRNLGVLELVDDLKKIRKKNGIRLLKR